MNILERIRKLLDRAAADETPEAENAAERARELMEKHGVTREEAEGSAPAAVVADQTKGYGREQVAFAVARSRGCLADAGKRGIKFRGKRAAVDNCVLVYQALVENGDAGAAMQSATAPESARAAWYECFWLGYAAQICSRLAEEVTLQGVSVEIVTPEDLARERAKNAARSAAEDAKEKLDQVSASYGADAADRLKERAFAAGDLAGRTAPIPKWTPPRDEATIRGRLEA